MWRAKLEDLNLGDTPELRDIVVLPRRLSFNPLDGDGDGVCQEYEAVEPGNDFGRECSLEKRHGMSLPRISVHQTPFQKDVVYQGRNENDPAADKVPDNVVAEESLLGSKSTVSVERPQFSSTVLGSRGALRGASRGAVPRERQTSSAQGPAEGEIRGEKGDRDGEEFFCSSRRGGLPRTPISRQSTRMSKNPNRYGYHQEKHYHFVTSWTFKFVFMLKLSFGNDLFIYLNDKITFLFKFFCFIIFYFLVSGSGSSHNYNVRVSKYYGYFMVHIVPV